MMIVSFRVTLALNVTLTTIHAIAIGLTTFRFYYRATTRRIWWDDSVALSAMLVDCVYVSILWFEYAGPNSVLRTHKLLVIQYWLGLMLFLVTIWGTRTSLALAIARIFPPGDQTRKFAIGMAVLFVILCLILISNSSAVCAHQPALTTSPEAACQWPTGLRVFIVVANLLSDTLLVAIPLHKLWRVRLPKEQRRLILGAFAASATTSTATLACSIFQFAPEKWEPAKTELREKLSYLETGISLIVCNLLVVVTYLHVRFHREEDLEVSDDTSESYESGRGNITQSNNVMNGPTRDSSGTTWDLTEVTGTNTFPESVALHRASTVQSTNLIGADSSNIDSN